MITCSNCGELVPVGMASCRRCGMPLSSMVGSAADFSQVAPQQPELPAWLESLRAGERGAPASGGQASFSAADLVDDGNLPSWMRSEQGGDNDSAQSGPQTAWRPAATPAPDTGEAFPLAPPQGFTAGSLIDEQSLPSWMRENQSAASGFQQAEPYAADQRNISASSLVQPDALPGWMKTLEAKQPPPAAPVQPQAQTQYPAPTPFAQQPPQYIPGSPFAQQSPQYAPGQPFAQPSPQYVPGQPISGHDLIDQQQLPGWMSGNNTNPNAAPNQSDANQLGGLKAASLLDMNSLPPWLREGAQEQRPPGFPAPQPPVQPTISPASSGSALTGASLIDMNALPDWLRPGAEQQPGNTQGGFAQQNMGDIQRQTSFGGHQRVENMRVPSRPRGEVGPQEQSEAAANVFASMLGVASATPYVPPQAGNDPFGNPPPSPQGWQMAPPSGQLPPQPGFGQMPGTSPGFSGPPPSPNAYQPGFGMGNQPPTPASYAMGSPQAQTANNQGKAQTKPAKRSFLDAIRDWFSR